MRGENHTHSKISGKGLDEQAELLRVSKRLTPKTSVKKYTRIPTPNFQVFFKAKWLSGLGFQLQQSKKLEVGILELFFLFLF